MPPKSTADRLEEIEIDVSQIRIALEGRPVSVEHPEPELGLLQRQTRTEQQLEWLLQAQGIDPQTGQRTAGRSWWPPDRTVVGIGVGVGIGLATALGLGGAAKGALDASLASEPPPVRAPAAR